jgi:hypothetical protein
MFLISRAVIVDMRCVRGRELTMRKLMMVAMLMLSSCGGPSWPDEQFPPQSEVARVLFAEEQAGLRETCEAIVVELTDSAAARLMGKAERRNGKLVVVPPDGWLSSPAPNPISPHSYFKGAFGGCNNEGKHPLGDVDGALERPGAFYKVINHGKGIAVIVPRAKLAGFFYFG